MRQFPFRDMIRREWIEHADDETGQVRELLQFYGVASSESWDDWNRIATTSFRKSQAFEGEHKSVSAWLREGERRALNLPCELYNRQKFKAALYEIRPLSRESPCEFLPRMEQLCSKAGVALVLVSQLPKTRVSGATRWLSPTKGLLQLSLRFKTDDHFWFSFYHEAAHILFHSKKAVFLENANMSGDEETEADSFASNFLIPEKEYVDFIQTMHFNRLNIEEFADTLGIAPGIVVGRLQHDRLIPFNRCNILKQRLEWVTERSS